MIILKETATVKQQVSECKEKGKSVGFVPTMGALHEGHISLIKKAKKTCDVVVCSIFINPAQFNDPADFEKYPVTIVNDVSLLLGAGTDILFLPPVTEIYPDGASTIDHYDLGNLENLLEGKYRPEHFQGVCKVMHKLLDVILPDVLLLGQKDYQQCLIVKRLIKILDIPVKVLIAETCRNKDGLAMSSRNLRLNEQQKEQASAIFKMLQYFKNHYKQTSLQQLEDYATNHLLTQGFRKIDYVTIADANTLATINETANPANAIALIAAYIADVRLIDNLMLSNEAD